MKAVDTNVIARALVRDDPHQTAIADRVLGEGVFVPLTVLLETAWLLRSRYRFTRAEVAASLRSLLDMPAVVVDAAAGVEWAIGRLLDRGDFADLLHLVASRGSTEFMTFDTDVEADAGRDAPVAVRTLR